MGFKPRPSGDEYLIEATTEFLNVDLELAGPSDLAGLVEALTPVFVLHITSEFPFVANLEVESGNVNMDCDATISALLDLVDKLDDDARGVWDQCTLRRFNVGLQSGLEPHCAEYSISAPSLQRLAAAGAEVMFTVYGSRYQPPD